VRSTLAYGLSLAVVIGSCSFDWDNFDPRLATSAATGGGGGAQGGMGGMGGVGGAGGTAPMPIPAADWSSSMLAVYTFEDANNLGRDSSGNGLDLSVIALDAPTSAMDPEPHQGAWSLLVAYGPPQTGLESAATQFESPPDSSITIGGWVKANSHPPAHALDAIARTGTGGYTLARSDSNALQCGIYDTSWQFENSADDSWPLDTWMHVVCRYDDSSNEVDGFLQGAPVLNRTGVMGTTVGSRTFGVPSAEADWGFDGLLDEVFVVMGALSDDAVARIAACGVDGKKCICDPVTPIGYLDCGEEQPSCSSLPPCDSAAP
jgi:hypothetical protein